MLCRIARVRRLLLGGLVAALLAACGALAPATPPVTPTPAATAPPILPSPTSPPPPTATLPPPPTATPSLSSSLVGPEWTVAAVGDLNADGLADVIAYKPAAIAPSSVFAQPEYADYTLVVTEVVIVQASAAAPELQLMVQLDGITAADTLLVGYPGDDPARTPAAFLMAVAPADVAPLHVIPINSAGEPFTQGVGVAWNGEVQAYRLVASGQLVPAAHLVGPEWTVIAHGDLNRDGKTDVLAYKPAALQPRAPNPNYPLAIAEAVIVQARLDGPPEVLLTITPAQIRAGDVTLLVYPTGDPAIAPAAFVLRAAPEEEAPIALIPINGAGEFYTHGIGVAWNPAEGAYRLVAIGG